MISQLREGLDYIRANPTIGWSLVYLAIASSLVGVLGVIGPDFATESLGLSTKDFVVVVLPLGIGVVLGVFGLNSYGRFVPRRRLIEIGLIALGVLVTLLSVAGPISRLLQRVESQQPVVDLSTFVSLLAVVIGIAFMAGIAYAVVAIPAQTQLQEELPEDVRGRVFGILNMLVSVASFLPIIIVGPIADWIGTTRVIVGVGVLIVVCGVASIFLRGPLGAEERAERTDLEEHPPGPVDHVAIVMTSEGYVPDSEGRRRPVVALSARTADLGAGLAVEPPPPPDLGEGREEHPAPDPDEPVFRSASDDGSQ
jgi:MFS family permease